MAPRSNVTLLALALVGTALAGCIENPLTAMRTDAEVSAFENKAIADDAAAELGEKVSLMGVMAFELSESEEASILPDPEVGNGLAPAWWYIYCVETKDAKEARAFKVLADGTLSSEADAEAMAAGYEHEMGEMIGAWEIDSTDALGAAKADESFRKVAEGFNASVVEGVARHEGRTAWWFAAMSADGFVIATVDAVTGELLEVESIDMDFEMPSFEWGARDPEMWSAEPVHLEAEGLAEPGGEVLAMEFTAAAPMFGMLEIGFRQMYPTDGLHWSIWDSDDELVADGHVRSWTGGDKYDADVEIEKAGEYTFTLEYMSWTPGFPGALPPVLAEGVEYALVMHLEPGHAEHDD